MISGFRHTNGIDRVVKNGLQLSLAFPQRLRRPFVLHNFCQERVVRGGQFRSAFLNPFFQLAARIGQFGGALLDSQLQLAMRCSQCFLGSPAVRDDRSNRHGRNTDHPHERLQKNERLVLRVSHKGSVAVQRPPDCNPRKHTGHCHRFTLPKPERRPDQRWNAQK